MFILLLSLWLPLESFADSVISPRREPGRSYLEYKNMARPLKAPDQPPPRPTTPVDLAKPGRVYSMVQIPDWGTHEVMVSRFKDIRDHQWLRDETHNQFLRRLTWLYPDDGCYARAAMMIQHGYSRSWPIPKKVFVFGNLLVQTPNTHDGEISWWYHVAPIVLVKGRRYVLDPSIEPKAPLPLNEWLERMSPTPKDLEIAICESGTYVPGEDCDKSTDGVEAGAQADELGFLDLEWNRLLDLGRDPRRELGAHPPWSH